MLELISLLLQTELVTLTVTTEDGVITFQENKSSEYRAVLQELCHKIKVKLGISKCHLAMSG